MSDIENRVKAIIADKLNVDESEVTPRPASPMIADSLDAVELIMEFEKEFNIAIPDDQAENRHCRRGNKIHRRKHKELRNLFNVQ